QLVISFFAAPKRQKIYSFLSAVMSRCSDICLSISESFTNNSLFCVKERRFFTENVSVSLIGQSASGGLPFVMK
ncbi:MAG: hypothetical protein IJP95_07345, partial [Bacteroidales bacterium]|nr:hypothetical protein [Bacteroidales bacterium]